ncbi:MAG: toprim domain-containing protein, partial [Firmicutes bacterium]|nr:toprim domain-containing protein [Bacillota bacterium]
AILVEGYMDVIGLYQGGVRNVTASLGTALTENQARLLKRYTDKVVLCYDSDNAGIKAAFTGIDVLRAANIDVRVMQVDDGKDPDEYMKRHSRDEFIDLALNKSRTDIDYKIFIISTRYDMDDTKQRVKFLEAAADVLRALPPVEQDVYISKVAADYHFSEGALRRQVEEGGKAGAPVVERIREPENSAEALAPNAAELLDPAMLQIERNIIRLLLLDSSYLEKLADRPDAIVSPQGVRIRDALQKLAAAGEETDVSVLRDSLGDAEANYLDEILLEIPVGEKDSDAFADCLRQLDIRRAKRRQKEIMDILSLDDGTIDHEQLDGLMKEYTTLERMQKR